MSQILKFSISIIVVQNFARYLHFSEIWICEFLSYAPKGVALNNLVWKYTHFHVAKTNPIDN